MDGTEPSAPRGAEPLPPLQGGATFSREARDQLAQVSDQLSRLSDQVSCLGAQLGAQLSSQQVVLSGLLAQQSLLSQQIPPQGVLRGSVGARARRQRNRPKRSAQPAPHAAPPTGATEERDAPRSPEKGASLLPPVVCKLGGRDVLERLRRCGPASADGPAFVGRRREVHCCNTRVCGQKKEDAARAQLAALGLPDGMSLTLALPNGEGNFTGTHRAKDSTIVGPGPDGLPWVWASLSAWANDMAGKPRNSGLNGWRLCTAEPHGDNLQKLREKLIPLREGAPAAKEDGLLWSGDNRAEDRGLSAGLGVPLGICLD